jgi:FdrA protein
LTDRLIVRRGAYHDSVTLMLASRDAEATPGIEFVAAVTATPINLELLDSHGFDTSDAGLGANDLVIAIRASDESAANAAVERVDARLVGGSDSTRPPEEVETRSVVSAARRRADLSMAFVSVPGRHAAYEVACSLEAGLDVFCFSDGLSLDDELALKRRALERGLLMLGGDCGTAIIDGIALGFANNVKRGDVGIVGASGTGIQQVTCLLDAAGVGISHAIGVGGRDLSARVGGLMTKRALELLAFDDGTKSIVVISKPPDERVAESVAEAAGRTRKPVVLGFLGSPRLEMALPSAVMLTTSLEEAAARAARLVDAHVQTNDADPPARPTPGAIRGLFCGGSLCFEVQGAVGPAGTAEDSFIDYGADELTEGRAHPMIDPTLRNDGFERAARDPTVGAIVLDVVLGYGSHDDPAADLCPRIEKALVDRTDSLTIIVSVCGTTSDPQNADDQARRLRTSGAIVTRSPAHAGRLAIAATRGE